MRRNLAPLVGALAVIICGAAVLALVLSRPHPQGAEWLFLSDRPLYPAASSEGDWFFGSIRQGGSASAESTELVAYDAAAHSVGEPLPTELVELPVPGCPRPLRVRKACLADRDLLVPDAASGAPWLYRSPDETAYATLIDGRLYLASRKTGQWAVKCLTPDVVGDYSLPDLLRETSGAKVAVLWADQPVWAEDSSAVFYLSNRKAVAEGGTSGLEIWSAAASTGENRLLRELPGISLVGVNAGRLVFSDTTGVGTLDLDTRNVWQAVREGRVLGFGEGLVCTAGDYLASPQATVTDLSSGRQRTIAAPAGKTFTHLLPGPRANLLVAVLRNAEGNHSLACYSYPRGALAAEYALPDGFTTVSDLFFLDARTLLLDVWQADAGGAVEASYVVGLDPKR